MTTATDCTCVHCPVHSLPEDAINVTTLAETPTTLTLTATAIGRCGHEVTYTATEKFKEPFTALGRFRAEDRHRQRTPKRHCSPACRRKSDCHQLAGAGTPASITAARTNETEKAK